MDYNNIEQKKKTIIKRLEQRRLNEALKMLGELATETSNWEIKSKIEAIEQSYKYMLNYMAEGVADPKRNEIYESIIAQAYELCDFTTNELIAQSSTKLHYSILRRERMRPENLTALLAKYEIAQHNYDSYRELAEKDLNQLCGLRNIVENIENDIFNHIWVAFPVNTDDLAQIRTIFTDEKYSDSLRELTVAAIMLNLLEHYSENLLLALTDIYSSAQQPSLQIKSMVCALIVMHKYRNIISHSQALALRMAAFADNKQASKDIMSIFLQFIRSRGTERIIKKVNNELVPEIMKLKPELRRKLQDSGVGEDMESLAENPDWQEMLDKSGITKKMQELNEMQMEGNDVFLSSFAQLKNFPFFSTVSNWFLPFNAAHSSVFRIFKTENNPLMTVINRTGAFCDSDKYSFALSVASVPEQQRAMMLGQFDEQNAQLMELVKSELPNPEKDRDNIANKYVQNLYRFFNLFSRKSEFYNPFSTPLNLIDVPFVRDILSDIESLKLIAEFYFKQEYFSDALSLFQRISLTEAPTADRYQKMGFCHENCMDFDKAIECYEKVELMKNDDVWTLKHSALCHRANGNIEKALDCYQRIEKLKPDNIAIANNIANCLLEAGKPEEALKYYFKVDYMADKGNKTLRPIAWCSFLCGNLPQSLEYYDKIIANGPSADDCINRGHALLASGNIKEAVESYKKAIEMDNRNIDKFIETLKTDKQYLGNAGVDLEDLPMIVDKIRYDLNL